MPELLTPQIRTETGVTFTPRLGGREFRIRLLWLPEAPRIPFQPDPGPPPLAFGESGVWTLNLSDATGVLLVAGQVLRHGVDVLAPFVGSQYPEGGAGRLLAWDTTGRDLDPGRDDLDEGSPVRLAYISAAEAAA